MSLRPTDQADRDLATTTFDRNIVVTAGAGTGKTTILINRLLHLLMREPGAISVTQIVALTFTNKSANEMKNRLRAVLEQIINTDRHEERNAALIQKYGLAKSQLDQRAKEALRDLERSQIGTIHHFAASLLRLYPIETGVDPLFQIDEGGEYFERCFKKSWSRWLENELSVESSRKATWQRAFGSHALHDIEALAKVLVSEVVSPDTMNKNRPKQIPSVIHHWLQSLEADTLKLLNAHPENRKIEKMLAASLTLFRVVRENGAIDENMHDADLECIASTSPGKVKGWEESEYYEAKQLIQVAKQLIQTDQETIAHLFALLKPFTILFYTQSRQEGWLSFDTLLTKARDLLRDHHFIREALKHRYQAILIDEFQDTDPVQYEILLYLAERPQSRAKNWHEVKLQPGKLFVVGDPKQSIYGFRRADIEAYHRVREMILGQNGIHCTLSTNFRSHKKILDTVNGVLTPLMRPKPGFQSEYIPIVPATHTPSEESDATDLNPFRAVSFRSIQDDTVNAETAKQCEGEAIAQWLIHSVLGTAEITDSDGKSREVKKGDVAILMRSLTGIHHILEPLRRAGIPYRVDGERHFYRQPIVNDAINLLRTVADPGDRMALVGLLRSPIGGLTDEEIYALQRENQLNYTGYSKTGTGLPPRVETLYTELNRLHALSMQLPVGQAIYYIFEQTPLRLLAAASRDGEQALANLSKLVHHAEQFAEKDHLGFRAVVDIFKRSVLDDIESPENPLAEEGIDAVRILSIHKAKGLEFPVVVLAGCQTGPAPGERDRAVIRHDWSTHLRGVRIGDVRDLAWVFLAEKTRLRETEEEKRILYVAMTRAREHLMFSSAFNGRLQKGSVLSHLHTAMGDSNALLDENPGTLLIGEGAIKKDVVSEIEIKYSTPSITPASKTIRNYRAVARLWKTRFAQYERLQNARTFSSPTQLKNDSSFLFTKTNKLDATLMDQDSASINSAFIGQVAHRFMEVWDFSWDIRDYPNRLLDFLNQQTFRETGSDTRALFEEIQPIFDVFFHSEAYAELTGATILGREIPFLMPWEGQVVEGIIDLIYEKENQIYIADYKTDRIQKPDLHNAAVKYQHQLQLYPKAVQGALKRKVAGMKLIFLRLGLSFETPPL